MERFGARGPAELLFDKFGFTAHKAAKSACEFLGLDYEALKAELEHDNEKKHCI